MPRLRRRVSLPLFFCIVCLVSFLKLTTGASDESSITCSDADGDGEGLCFNNEGSRGGGSSINNKDEDEDLCRDKYSQTSLAIEMARLSSPPGSPSFYKLQKILNDHGLFWLDFDLGGNQDLFNHVGWNIEAALEGYGLERLNLLEEGKPAPAQGMVKVETFFSRPKTTPDGSLYMHERNTAVILLQTEQICCSHYGTFYLSYLRQCHAAPTCIIWEYSHLNWQWSVQNGLGDSVVLLPILHQHRLDLFYNRTYTELSDEDQGDQNDKSEAADAELEEDAQIEPFTFESIQDRDIDVVFFGVMTERRKIVAEQLQQIGAQQQWNMKFEEVENSGSRLDYMANAYQNAKVCLILHSFRDNTPGEYHRLSELAPSGCWPVVETFGDDASILDKYYRDCGGVVFSNLAQIPILIQMVLNTIQSNKNGHAQNKMQQRMAWWNDKIQWRRLLTTILDDRD
jgi:hypothetical protein